MEFEPQTVKNIFDQCVGITGSKLDETLLMLCGNNQSLREEVEALLVADRDNQGADGFLQWPGKTSVWAEFPPDTLIEGFRIQENIGAGSNGQVYLAINESGDRFAIKFLLPWAANAIAMARFQREATTLSTIQHPNVARLIKTGEWDDRRFLITEFVDGLPLDKKLEAFPETRIGVRMEWLLNSCRGVAAIHEHLLLHRDLKPSNILVRADNSVVVTDFGIAKPLTSRSDIAKLTLTGEFLGTPKYMAPEQLESSGRLVLATDVYGLGGVMYFLLTGRPPFQEDSLIETVDAVRHNQPVSPTDRNSQVDQDLATICLKCLSKEPSRRYQSVTELMFDLENWIDGKPINARPISLLGNSFYWIRRNPVVCSLSLALLVFTITGIVALSLLWKSAERHAGMAKEKNDQLLEMLDDLARVERAAHVNNRDLIFRQDVLRTLAQGYDKIETTNRRQEKASAVAWLKLGRVEWGLGNRLASFQAIDRAIKKFQDLAKTDPSNIEYQFDVFHCLNDQERYRESLACIEKLVELEPDNEDFQDALSHAHFKAGEFLLKKGDVKLAFAHVDRAEHISSSLVQDCSHEKLPLFRKKLALIWNWQSRAKLEFGQREEAELDLERALVELRRATNAGLGEVVMRQEIYALLLSAALKTIDQDYSGALEQIRYAEVCSREFVAEHASLPHAYECRYRVLQDFAFLAFSTGDKQLHNEVQAMIEDFFEDWKSANTSRHLLAKLKSDFLMDPHVNLRPSLPQAKILMGKQPQKGTLAYLRYALHSRDFKTAKKWIDSWPNSFDRDYYSYYSHSIHSLSNGMPIDVDKLPMPDRGKIIVAVARNAALCEVLGFQHFARELGVLGLPVPTPVQKTINE